MDIVVSKKSKLLYQKGDTETEGVVDLSQFQKVQQDRALLRSHRILSDIAVHKKTPLSDAQRKHLIRQHHEKVVGFFDDLIAKYQAERAELLRAQELVNSTTQKTKFKKPIFASKQSSPFSDTVVPAKPRPIFALASKAELAEKLRQIVAAVQNFVPPLYAPPSNWRFALASASVMALVFSLSFVQSQIEVQGRVLGVGAQGLQNFKTAATYASEADFDKTAASFNAAGANFLEARQAVEGLGLGIGKLVSELPVDTPISSAQNLAAAGENLAAAGRTMGEVMQKLSQTKESGQLLNPSVDLNEDFQKLTTHIKQANTNLQKVDLQHLPAEQRTKVALAQETLPLVTSTLENFYEDFPLLQKMLGSERTQKYLLLFQNNSEMRPTGGFIGSYGILDLENGSIKNLFVDDIYNPDGQLKEHIVAPMPMQKVSAAWTMHDANWFADYPTSAKKAALLYEKTGGSTVDGVIAITPELTKALLSATGPIPMPQYGITIDQNNFVELTQNQVEQLYDKKENRPKKILTDLTKILMQKFLGSDKDKQVTPATDHLTLLKNFDRLLKEKQILIYSRDTETETMLKKRGWGGEVKTVEGDYLSIINTNLNGYKTDAVIEEKINLLTEISPDGSITNTVSITRKHNGGNSPYDWYNRVNSNYMRIYVPQGSTLLEAKGGTPEEYVPPVDFKNYSRDEDIEKVEKTLRLEANSKTQVFEESDKTVFGNWVYVSPQDEVTVTYKYRLPFKISLDMINGLTGTYKNYIQKQSGSIGSKFTAEIKFPKNWQVVFRTAPLDENQTISTDLRTDFAFGAVFTAH